MAVSVPRQAAAVDQQGSCWESLTQYRVEVDADACTALDERSSTQHGNRLEERRTRQRGGGAVRTEGDAGGFYRQQYYSSRSRYAPVWGLFMLQILHTNPIRASFCLSGGVGPERTVFAGRGAFGVAPAAASRA